MKMLARFRDIISSHINAILGRAENPEKLIKLMIVEIEETLCELKRSCAKIIAENKKTGRMINEFQNLVLYCSNKASLAVNKGRDGLARESLIQKRNYSTKIESLEMEMRVNETVIKEYKEDICLLEDKLAAAKEKLYLHVSRKRRAQLAGRRLGSPDTMYIYELENRIRHLEADNDPDSLYDAPSFKPIFEELAINEEIEEELKVLKVSRDKTVEI